MARSSSKDSESRSTSSSSASSTAGDDKTLAQVQEQVDREQEQGFRGVEVDTTPNENYTVAGVIAGAPTPEADAEQAEQARQGQADTARAVDADPSRK